MLMSLKQKKIKFKPRIKLNHKRLIETTLQADYSKLIF